MQFTRLLPAVMLIEPSLIQDHRGFFARAFCEEELGRIGVHFRVVQMNISHSVRKGTLRGMHYQRAPNEEEKIVSCVAGSIYDVVIDIKHNSPTYLRWVGVELSRENRRMLYIPKGFAHGFVTLCDDTDVLYLMGQPFAPQAAAGIRYNDPVVGINWPDVGDLIVSERDRQHDLLECFGIHGAES